MEELQDDLKDLYEELTNGNIPGVRFAKLPAGDASPSTPALVHVAELRIA